MARMIICLVFSAMLVCLLHTTARAQVPDLLRPGWWIVDGYCSDPSLPGVEQNREAFKRAQAQAIAQKQAEREARGPTRASIISGPKQGRNDTWICSVWNGYVRKDATFCKHCHRPF